MKYSLPLILSFVYRTCSFTPYSHSHIHNSSRSVTTTTTASTSTSTTSNRKLDVPLQLQLQGLGLRATKEGEWKSIVPKDDDDDDASSSSSLVKKLILQQGNEESIPSPGSTVEINYVGTLGGSQEQWSVDDVIECWLQSQQGLSSILEGPFRSFNVDGTVLMDPTAFTEEFVSNDLGVSNKIQCKKTIMAAKRLWKQVEEFPEGDEFDSSSTRGKSFTFVLGEGKVIKAMDLAVATMQVGEKARVVCRSDYGYGAEGYRTVKGDVVVPPFRTLCFDIELVSASSSSSSSQ